MSTLVQTSSYLLNSAMVKGSRFATALSFAGLRGELRVFLRVLCIIFAARKTTLSKVSRVEHVEGARCLKGRRRLGIEIHYWCYNAEHAFNKEISPN